jgi:hypothetical protein
MIPIKCQFCGEMDYVPEYRFLPGFWCGDIVKYLHFECPKGCPKYRVNL